MTSHGFRIDDIRYGDNSFTTLYMVAWSAAESLSASVNGDYTERGYAQVTRESDKWDVTLVTGTNAPSDEELLSYVQMYRYWEYGTRDYETIKYHPIAASWLLFCAEHAYMDIDPKDGQEYQYYLEDINEARYGVSDANPDYWDNEPQTTTHLDESDYEAWTWE